MPEWMPKREGIRSTRGHRLRAKPPKKRGPRSDRIILNRDALHRHFWRRRGRNDRLTINVGTLGDSLGVSYPLANKVVIDMRTEGRMCPVGWEHPRMRVYEIVNPEVWDPNKPETHVPPERSPKWG